VKIDLKRQTVTRLKRAEGRSEGQKSCNMQQRRPIPTRLLLDYMLRARPEGQPQAARDGREGLGPSAKRILSETAVPTPAAPIDVKLRISILMAMRFC